VKGSQHGQGDHGNEKGGGGTVECAIAEKESKQSRFAIRAAAEEKVLKNTKVNVNEAFPKRFLDALGLVSLA